MAEKQQDMSTAGDIGVTTEGQKSASSKRTYKGHYYETVHVKRKVNIYHVTEAELRSIGSESATSKWSLNACIGFGGFAIGLIFDFLIQGAVSEFAKGALAITIPFCAVVSIVCFALWWKTTDSAKGDVADILSTNKDEEEI